MPRQLMLETLVKGQIFEGLLLVRKSEVRVSQNGSRFLDAILCDKTRELAAKAWEWGDQAPPKPLSVVRVRAIANEYMGKLQLKLETLTPIAPTQADYAYLVPCAPERGEDMLAQIHAVIDEMEDEDLKLVAAAAVEENKTQLLYWPAAVSYHHSERCGLLHHTTTMLRAAKALLPVYPFLDADLLLCGVILHDLCKIRELDAGAPGIAGEYTRAGQLLGHITMGTAYLLELTQRLEIPEEKGLLLSHMILAHHNGPEFGSPRYPMFAEAEMLHHLDVIDARMYDMQSYLSQIEPGQFTGIIRSLDGRRLYRHEKFDPDA